MLDQDKTSDKAALVYMEDAVGQDEMMKVINNYQHTYSKKDAYKMVAENLKSTYEEVQANNFSQDQAKGLFVSASNLESGTAKVSKIDFSSKIPDFAPTHPEMKSNSNDISFLSNSDKSTRTSY